MKQNSTTVIGHFDRFGILANRYVALVAINGAVFVAFRNSFDGRFILDKAATPSNCAK